MKHLISTAFVYLFLSGFHDACAAGPYDGEWTGSATATDGHCKPAIVTLTVLGTVVTGQAKMDADAQNINGTVREDGTIGATIGWQPLIGKFVEDGLVLQEWRLCLENASEAHEIGKRDGL